MKIIISLILGFILGFGFKAYKWGLPVSHVYTLYQVNTNHPELPARLHLATFDSRQVKRIEAGTNATSFNQHECELFRDLFVRGAQSANVKVNAFCEQGYVTYQ